MNISRRDLLQAGAFGASIIGMGAFRVSEAATAAGASQYAGLYAQLDRFVEQYMRDMNSPGMTLVLADRDAVQRVVTYGFGDPEARKRVAEDELFEIGSISKSFVALALLQLHDEGKLDFHRPVVEYLPWLRIESSFAPITTHHLLTHTTGLAGAVFPTDPEMRHLAAYAPGEQFHYNNAMYDVLGLLAWTLDGRELPELLRERILRPLGMNRSEPVITLDIRERLVRNYAPFKGDRPYARHGRLCEASSLIVTSGAGCVASTAADMGAYVRMIARHGRAAAGRLVSEEGFGLFSRGHILAPDFGPGAQYGYGIAVDTLDGNRLLRHTGGMVSFMSSLMVDIDEGIGAFASVNAQQRYRPNPVVRYAIQLMRARRKGAEPPAMPEADDPKKVTNADDFAGSYSGDKGKLQILADGDRLFVLHGGARVPLERLSDAGRFLARDPALERFAFAFGRNDPENDASAVVELSWGGDWYRNDRYEGPVQFDYPKQWDSYVGHYRNESPWIGSLRIFVSKGRLMLDGAIPLEADGDIFRLRDNPKNTEWIRFGESVNGRCMRIRLSGSDLWRVAAP